MAFRGQTRCAVLPLGEAVERLYRNDLPDRAVALTFDDGFADFYHRAFPIISEFGFPVTLYLTTFYSYYNRPVFDVVCSYLLWRGRARTLNAKDFIGEDVRVNLATRPDLLAEGVRRMAHAVRTVGRSGVSSR